MKNNKRNYGITIFGIALLGIGLFLIKTISNPQNIMRVLPYLSIGLGCGIFGHGMGNIVSNKVMKNSPDSIKQIEIEQNDERNIMISNRAKAKAYDMMVFVFGALLFTFALMNINIAATLLFVFAYLFIVSYSIYYRIKYDKEM